jgi:hypothetical protein
MPWVLTDVILSPWPDEADSTGIKVRNIAYTLSLNYSIGPKYSPSTERQVRLAVKIALICQESQ